MSIGINGTAIQNISNEDYSLSISNNDVEILTHPTKIEVTETADASENYFSPTWSNKTFSADFALSQEQIELFYHHFADNLHANLDRNHILNLHTEEYVVSFTGKLVSITYSEEQDQPNQIECTWYIPPVSRYSNMQTPQKREPQRKVDWVNYGF